MHLDFNVVFVLFDFEIRDWIGDWKWTRTRTKSLTTRGHVSYGRNHFHTTSKCKNREEYIEVGGRNWRGHAWNMQKYI